MTDGYGPIHREHMKHEIEREDRMLKKARQWWWNWSDDIGMFLWIIVGFIVSALAWMVYGCWPR